MQLRERTLYRKKAGGTIRLYGSNCTVAYKGNREYTFLYRFTRDFHKKQRRESAVLPPYPPSDFKSVLGTVTGPSVSLDQRCVRRLTSFALDRTMGGPLTDVIDITWKGKSDQAYAQKLLDRTSPFRAEFSIPVAIRELVDISQMFRLVGNSLLQLSGNAYLNYRFGWQTFLQDLKKLDNIVKLVDQRVREFDSLFRTGGLRRNIFLDHYSHSDTFYSTSYMNSTFGVWIEGRPMFSDTRTKVWGSVRWIPKGNFRVPEGPDRWRLAVQQVFDVGPVDAKTIWDIIPWTWLIDYFVSVGDFLGSNTGRLLVEPADICIMRETETVQRIPVKSSASSGTYVVRAVEKRRKVVTNIGGPQVFGTLLSMSELQVVAALFAKWRG